MDEPANKADDVETTAPPATVEGTGVALYGAWPDNHRLRAEALARAGEEADPDGIISNDLIAETASRLEREDAAAAAARPAVSTSLRRETLDAIAEAEGLDPAAYPNKDELVAAIETKRAANGTSNEEE
jgi:hypothetical protein